MCGQARFERLEREEHRILGLAAQGWTEREVAERLGVPYDRLRRRLSRTYKKLSVRNLQAATAWYAHQLGLRNELLVETPEHCGEAKFVYGRLRFNASVVSSSLASLDDLHCVVMDERFEDVVAGPLSARLDGWRDEARAAAHAVGRIAYERPRQEMLVVTSLETDDEAYRRIRMHLRRAWYLTYVGAREHQDELGQLLVEPDPDPAFTYVRAPQRPRPVGILVHVIAVNERHERYLIVARRALNIGSFPGFSCAAVHGWGEAGHDLALEGGERRYLPASTMTRELLEERSLDSTALGEEIQPKDFPRRLKPLGLIFDHWEMSYSLAAYLEVHVSPQRICDRLSRARETIGYEAVRFIPEVVCPRLREGWMPNAAISLVMLLEEKFGEEAIYPLLA